MAKQFDLIVLGSGSAGSAAAFACRSAGWNVGVVDSRPFGGTCALRGCDPKRVLIGAAELVDWSRRFGANGVTAGELRIDWPALVKFKDSFTDPVPEEKQQAFDDAGIASFHGRAHFTTRTAIDVDSETLIGRFVVIASGAKHRDLHLPGEEHLITSTQFLDLPQLPARIIFVGGGYISFEFAHLAARAGAKVQILHRGSRPLGGFDPELVDRLVRISRDIGIEIHLNTTVTAIEKKDGDVLIHANEGNEERTFAADLAVHGAGRVPEIDDLRLDVASVARTKKGVTVNEHLQSTTNPAVYAAGDAADGGGFPLTPVAGIEGEIVAENLLKGNHRSVDFRGLASCVYTIPPLATVGLSEPQARERGLQIHVKAADTAGWFSSRRLAVRGSSFKVVVEDGTDTVLGASILGPHAEELVNLFALAIRAKISALDLRTALYAYPTAASDLDEMA